MKIFGEYLSIFGFFYKIVWPIKLTPAFCHPSLFVKERGLNERVVVGEFLMRRKIIVNWKEFYQKAKTGIVFSDGSMGVFLQKHGLKGGDCPELWNIEKPEIVESVHKSYIKAGSDLIITNTLGGNRVKLSDFGLEKKLKDLNEAGIRVAKKAAGGKAIVAADVGPTGLFIEPLGKINFDEMVDIYKEQIIVLANAGADCIFFETHIDVLELKAGILACREVCGLPIIASMTFEKDGRTVTGSSPEAVFTTLEALGVDIMGTNCGTGPFDMLQIVERIQGLFSTPFIAQANAGMPVLQDGKTVFTETPEVYGESALKILECGVGVIGGCCGTTPEHIRLLHERARQIKPGFIKGQKGDNYLKLSSRYEMRKIGFDIPFTIIGERLNPTARKALSQDILNESFSLFKEEALNQEGAGAHLLDMNMGIPDANEAMLVKKGVELLSNLVKTPLAIDSSNLEAVRAGLRIYPGKAVLNSISAEKERLSLLKEVKKYGAAFIALPIDERGIPATAEERVKLMRKIIDEAARYGIDKKNILADPLALTVSAEQKGAKETLKTIRLFKEELGLLTTIGLSNVSYGLPARGYVNRGFLSMAIQEGLTSAIVNPFDEELMGIVKASDVILGKDEHSKEYIKIYSNSLLTVNRSQTSNVGNKSQISMTQVLTVEEKLKNSILHGQKESIAFNLNEALQKGLKAAEILNQHLIPAITEVGELYDKRIYFLPQLMLSAETMKAAFVVLEPLLKEESVHSKGKIVFATVKGDVHDIGKNIVSLMLLNHGFEVIDLGKDVPNEAILKKAIEIKADIIGLSALMTTTMSEMKKFMELLKKENQNLKVMVGGAAVTRVFAESIGAHYSVDAVDAVKVANKLMQK